MIRYKPMDMFPSINIPVLHKVVYDRRESEVIKAQYQRSYKDCLVDSWLEATCKHAYYHSPGYIHEKFIHFEDDQEAVMFALRWCV